MSSTVVRIAVISVGLALSACATTTDIRPTASPAMAISRLAEFWEEPTDLSTRDLLNGPWGTVDAPDGNGTYTFIRKKRKGTNPGMTVQDSQGREWHIKQGPESRPEVLLSHVLAAIGYHQPPVYFIPSFTLGNDSGRHTERGGRFRLHTASLKDRGEWSWDQNPFVGTQPYQGLLVILVLFNSADLKNENNTLYEVKKPLEGPASWLVVRDLGSSLGATGRFNPREDDPDVFERHGFITGQKDGFVEFDYHAVHSDLVHHRIRPGDVQWASQLLGALTDRQWHDAFRSAGYTPPVADRFIRRIRQKIEDGQQLRVEAGGT